MPRIENVAVPKGQPDRCASCRREISDGIVIGSLDGERRLFCGEEACADQAAKAFHDLADRFREKTLKPVTPYTRKRLYVSAHQSTFPNTRAPKRKR